MVFHLVALMENQLVVLKVDLKAVPLADLMDASMVVMWAAL